MDRHNMRQQPTRDLYAYWNELRNERAAPERVDFDPVAIRGLLGTTFMLEVDAAATYPVRVSSTSINNLFDRELRGNSFVDLFAAHERGQVTRLCATISDDTVAVVAGLQGGPDGETPASLEMLLLPLRHRGKTHARIVGAIVAAASPAWLGLVAIAHLSLCSMRIVIPDASASRDPQRAQVIRRDSRMQFPGDHLFAAPLVRRGHLSLYQGGK